MTDEKQTIEYVYVCYRYECMPYSDIQDYYYAAYRTEAEAKAHVDEANANRDEEEYEDYYDYRKIELRED